MNTTLESFQENPFCNECLDERLMVAAAEREAMCGFRLGFLHSGDWVLPVYTRGNNMTHVPQPDVDRFYLSLAEETSKLATCDRKHVGAVVVQPKEGFRHLGVGANGSPPGTPTCDEVGHLLKDVGGRPSCLRTLHAEQYALQQALASGTSVRGATIYVTVSPCYECCKQIIAAGISRVVVGGHYTSRAGMDDEVCQLFEKVGIIYDRLVIEEKGIDNPVSIR